MLVLFSTWPLVNWGCHPWCPYLSLYTYFMCVSSSRARMWGSSVKASHAVSFVFFSDHMLPGTLLSSTYFLFCHTDHCKPWSQYCHPYLGHRSPFRFVMKMLSGRTLPWLRCGVTIVLCWWTLVSYLHLKSPGNSFLRSTAGARGQSVSGAPLLLLALGLLKQSVAVIAAQWESSPASPSWLLTPASCWAASKYINKPLWDHRDSWSAFDSSALVPLVYLCLHRKEVIFTSRVSRWATGEDIPYLWSLRHSGSLFWRL